MLRERIFESVVHLGHLAPTGTGRNRITDALREL